LDSPFSARPEEGQAVLGLIVANARINLSIKRRDNMIERTAVVVGPGGVGKSPLDALFRDDMVKIDPYRLRSDGPRDSNDLFYAHPKFRNELHLVLTTLGDKLRQISCPGQPIEWFPRAEVLFYKVRDDWQLLILNGLEGQIAKAEIYAPILPTLLSTPDISSLFGKVKIIVLNPASESVMVTQDWKYLEDKTEKNCTQRGDSLESVQERVHSIAKEAPAWKQLIQENAATEYCDWEFPEYLYKRSPPEVSMVEYQKQMLTEARSCLLEGNPDLDEFFKDEEQVKRMGEPFVK
jgi:hypothetical protein